MTAWLVFVGVYALLIGITLGSDLERTDGRLHRLAVALAGWRRESHRVRRAFNSADKRARRFDRQHRRAEQAEFSLRHMRDDELRRREQAQERYEQLTGIVLS